MEKNPILSSYKLNCEVLSPVHIGTSGTKLKNKNIDYFHVGERVYLINQERLMESLLNEEGAIENYIDIVSSKNANIYKLIDDLDILDAVTEVSYDYGTNDLNCSELRPFIRTGNGLPYIPGSSLKGAVRSAIFHFLYTSQRLDRPHDKLNRELLGDFDKSITRFIKVGDAHFKQSNLELSDILLFNLKSSTNGWYSQIGGSRNKDGYLSMVENLVPQSKAQFQLTLADGLFRKIKSDARDLSPNIGKVFKAENSRDNLDFLFKNINICTKKHIERELEFFDKYSQAVESDDAKDCLLNIMNELKEIEQTSGVCVLRMAYGSGFHSITGEYRYSKHTEPITSPDRLNRDTRYKSRRLAERKDSTELMGFVKLSLE